MTIALEIIASAFRLAFPPAERITCAEWAEKHRVISARFSARAGPWRHEACPYARGLLESFGHGRVRRVSIMKGEQVFGTEALINLLAWTIDKRPRPTLWVYPSADVARRVNKRRLLPQLRDIPAVAQHFTGSKHDENVLELSLDRMDVYFAGAGTQASERNLEGTPCGLVIIDERDRCLPGGDVYAVVRGRVSTYPDHLIVENGTPGDGDVGIDAAFHGGDQRRYHVPCPECGKYHTRDFAQVRWEGGADADPKIVRATAWYECPDCKASIPASRNLWQLSHGCWAADGETVESDGRIASMDPWLGPCLSRLSWDALRAGGGEPFGVRIKDPVPWRSHVSYHVHGLLTPFKANPYGDAAAEFVDNGCMPTRDWCNRRLGVAWRTKAERLDDERLRRLCIPVESGGYRLGEVPADVLALTAVIDVQSDHCWLEVTGWGAGGKVVCLIDWRRLDTPEGNGLRELDAIPGRVYPRAGRAESLPVIVTGIDSGHRTVDVIDFCRRAREVGRIVVPIKGRWGETMATPHYARKIETYPDGSPIPGGMLLLNVNTDHWKQVVFGRLRAAEDAVLAGQASAMRFPADTPRDYLRQLTAEERVVKHDAHGTRYEWRLRQGRADNHALDTRQYAEALADRNGVRLLGGEPTAAPTTGTRAASAAAGLAARFRR